MRSALDGHALVIGINDYRGGITPLQSAASDAEAVTAMLKADHGYRARCLIDADASSAAILQALADARDALSEDSGFLLYFAGHGVALGEGDQGPQGFLLAQDALPTDERSWLSMDDLRQALEQLPCRHVLVVLDCCFAGSFRWSSSRDAALVSHPLYDSQLARFLDGQAWLALTSASHDQRAADTLPGRRNTRDAEATGRHSPFALAFMRGLAGAADSARARRQPDGVITATELYQFLFDELMPAGASSRQTPGLWPLRPSNVGEFVFLNPSAALNTLPDPPLDDQNNPWLGLRAYEANDAALFFGRRRVVSALIDRASDPAVSLLVVVGASGTGKSSVVKAGLLPALLALDPETRNDAHETRARWQIVQVPRLRGDPSVQLNRALAVLSSGNAAERQLLLIDQFEELYTQCRDATLRDRFLLTLRALIERPDGPLVVLTLRSDFEPRLAGCEQFSALLPAARFLVPTFSTEEMREIVEAPLAAKALYFEPPELVDRLLDEVAAMPGALPLLSFALAEMYRHAQRRRRETGSADRALNQDDYLATGGVVGALHRRAAELHDAVDADLQRTIQRVFLRMVLQEGARIARRRVNLMELEFPDPAEQARVTRVLGDYVEARLLVVDQQYIEPAHDTLVVAWDMLQEWLAASSGQPILRAMWRDTRDWEAAARPAGLLWDADPRLPQAAAMRPELNTLERRFVRASVRRKRYRRWSFNAIGLLVMIALGIAALYSMERADEAIRQTRIAGLQLAKSQFSAGRANLALANASLATQEPFAALLSAGEAIGYRNFGIAEVAADADADDSLNANLPPRLIHRSENLYVRAITVLTEANLATLRPVAWRALHSPAISAGSAVLAGVGDADAIEVRDFSAGVAATLTSPGGVPQLLALSDDGTRLAAVLTAPGQPARVALWRADEGWQQAEPRLFELPRDEEIFALSFDPTSQRLAAVMANEVVLWNLQSARSSDPGWISLGATQDAGQRSSLAFTADGKALLSGGWHNRLTRYPLPPVGATQGAAGDSTPRQVRGRAVGPEWTLWSENASKGDYVNAIEVSRRGDFVVLASANQILVGAVDGESLNFSDQRVYQTRTKISRLALSRDGSLLAFDDGELVRVVRFPSLESAGVLTPLTFSTSELTSLGFLDGGGAERSGPDAGEVLVLGGPGKIELVDVSGLTGSNVDAGAEAFASSLAPASQAGKLRDLIDNGQLDPLLLAFPDSEYPPGGMQWEIVEDYDDDGLDISLSQQLADGELSERGTVQLRLQPGAGRQVAVGVSQFDNIQLRGNRWATLDLVNIADQALVFRHMLSGDQWGLNRLRYSDDGERLLVQVSWFDGGIDREYSFPTAPPDLTVYLRPAACQSPVNLLSTHWLLRSQLLDCGAVAVP